MSSESTPVDAQPTEAGIEADTDAAKEAAKHLKEAAKYTVSFADRAAACQAACLPAGWSVSDEEDASCNCGGIATRIPAALWLASTMCFPVSVSCFLAGYATGAYSAMNGITPSGSVERVTDLAVSDAKAALAKMRGLWARHNKTE